MKNIVIVLMALVMVFAMAACGNNGGAAGGNGSGQMIDVCMEVDYPDNGGMPDVENYWLQVPEGSTALDVLNEFAKLYGIGVVMSDNDSAHDSYVVSIGDVAENAGAGWAYEVNDNMPMETAAKYIVENKDEITWEFMSWYDD